MNCTRWDERPRWAFKIGPDLTRTPTSTPPPKRCPRRIEIERCYVLRSCEADGLYEVLGVKMGVFELDSFGGERWITNHVFTDLEEARAAKDRLEALEELAGDAEQGIKVFRDVEELQAEMPVAWMGQVAFVGDPHGSHLDVYSYMDGWRRISLPPSYGEPAADAAKQSNPSLSG